MAEVPDPQVPDTCLNHALLGTLLQSQRLVVAGEASSHCVRATVEHLLEAAPPGFAPRLVLLTDCMSPVHGFAAQHADFLQRMQAIGVRCETSASFGL